MMGFTESQEKRYGEFFAELKKCDSSALAMELACIFVVVPLINVQRAMENIRNNSRIAQHNKRVKTKNNKINRLKELAAKKKPTKPEQEEMVKLAKDLGIKW
jgi:hypothetical protein